MEVPLWRHFPKSSKSFKAIYRNQTTTESFKLGTMYIFLDEKMDLLSLLQKLEI